MVPDDRPEDRAGAPQVAAAPGIERGDVARLARRRAVAAQRDARQRQGGFGVAVELLAGEQLQGEAAQAMRQQQIGVLGDGLGQQGSGIGAMPGEGGDRHVEAGDRSRSARRHQQAASIFQHVPALAAPITEGKV